MNPTRIALVGMGKIARVEHVPAIHDNDEFTWVAAVEPTGDEIEHVPTFRSVHDLISSGTPFDAVAVCTPPQMRHEIATSFVNAGKHVLLEKPPCATMSQAAALAQLARDRGVALYAAWHSRGAAGVAAARTWLSDKQVYRVSVEWREDVRTWHPKQTWIWQPGGLGVFDAGINSLAIATHILPRAMHLTSATLVFPSNRDAPIAAQLTMADTAGAAIDVAFDWRHTGPQTWDITVETNAGTLKLSRGGSFLTLPSGETVSPQRADPGLYYPEAYAEFARVVKNRAVEIDIDPLRLVADAFLVGRRETTESFYD